MPTKRRPPFLLIIIAVIIVLVVAIIWWFKPDNAGKPSSQTESTALNSQTNASIIDEANVNNNVGTFAKQDASQFTTGLENLPRSLQGTEVDGEIIIDENKQLVVTEGLRRLFDYFLSARTTSCASRTSTAAERRQVRGQKHPATIPALHTFPFFQEHP